MSKKSLLTRDRLTSAPKSCHLYKPAKNQADRGRGLIFLQTIERLGVTLQNLVGLGVADPALVRPAADFVQRAQIGGDIGVAVIGADHQIIFSSKLQERLDIVNRVDGDE